MADRTRAKYVMSVAADLVEMRPQTLRKYEREGLLELARYDGYHRMYSDEEVTRLTALRELAQGRGINVAGLRVLMEVLGVVERMERLIERRTKGAKELRDEITRMRSLLGASE